MPPPHRRAPAAAPTPPRVPPSRIVSFLDREGMMDALAGLVPDPHDRDFIVRCLIEEGPAHHRGANYALVVLLLDLLAALDAAPGPAADTAPAPMRLSPHLLGDGPPADYPLPLDLAPLRAVLADPAAVEAAVDCLTDGPPQHAVANVVMVNLIGAARAAIARARA